MMVDIENPRIERIGSHDDEFYGRFTVEPLDRGYGHTLGNALRRVLLSSIPDTDPTHRKRPIKLEGNLPNPDKKVRGCPFAGRCHRQVGAICARTNPPLLPFSDTHHIYCHIEFEDAHPVS